MSLCLALVALSACSAASRPSHDPAPATVDHILIGASDLDLAIDEFEAATGVRAVYGGRHPTGTHNVLVALGDGVYLELIAVQSGVQAPPAYARLPGLGRLTPIGWAASAADEASLRQQLVASGFAVTDPRPGSRVTPAGATLRWRTFGLRDPLAGAPFFIAWAADSPHPSSTSPRGCTLERFTVAGPDPERLERLRSLVAGPVEVVASPTEQFTVALDCPAGRVVFEPGGG
jgi:hypothetical protein